MRPRNDQFTGDFHHHGLRYWYRVHRDFRRMTAEIINLPIVRIERPGNGAREALIDVANTFPSAMQEDSEKWADYILCEFWMRGFKVVPLE